MSKNIYILNFKNTLNKKYFGEFPGGPVVRTWCTAVGPGSIPGQGTKIVQATRHTQKKKKKKTTLLLKNADII